MTTHEDSLSALREARRITRNMVDLAEKRAWSKLPECQRRRQMIFERVFVRPSTVTEIPGVAGLIQDILELNSRLISATKNERKETKEQISRARRGRDGASAYSKIAVG